MSHRKLTAVLLLVLGCLLILAFFVRVRNEMVDFEVNYTAAQRLRLGETLYRPSDGHYQFKYMPFSAFLYLPLSLLPVGVAKTVWFAVVLVCSFLIFFISFKLICREEKRGLWLAILPALILARYFLREIQLGQINALITVLLLMTIWLLTAQGISPVRRTIAGLLAGTATALKPYALIFLPYFILRRKWASFAGGLVALALALVVPSLFYGFKGNWLVLQEWRSSLTSSTPALFSTQDNVSLVGFYVKWTGHAGLSFLLYLFTLAGLGFLLLFLLARGKAVSRPALLEGFLLLCFIPLVSPLGWDYTFLAAAPAVMLTLSHFEKYRPFWRAALFLNFAVISLTLYDLMGREAYASFMSMSVITICFFALIAYLSYLRVKGHA